MALNKPTSKQLKGHFDALRATKSHTQDNTIDIAAGNYGSGKTFVGVDEVFDPDWLGASSNFYIYLDIDGNLILNGTDFPQICTRIAQVVLDAGEIVDIIDERSAINSPEDGYGIVFDDSNTFIVAANNIQDAITSLDGYVYGMVDRLATSVTKYQDLPLLSGALNGAAQVTQASYSPAINMPKRAGLKSRVMYTMSLPNDYIQGTDLKVKVFWSTPSAEVGDTGWKLEYRSLISYGDEVDSLLYTDEYFQNAPGVDNRLVDTGGNLVISATNIYPDTDLLIINIVREGTVFDTFNYDVRVHLIRVEYMGKGVN
jgi:hypothetical protein